MIRQSLKEILKLLALLNSNVEKLNETVLATLPKERKRFEDDPVTGVMPIEDFQFCVEQSLKNYSKKANV